MLQFLLVNDGSRLGLVYVHLIACCVGLGLVLTNDLGFVMQLVRGDPSARQHPDLIQRIYAKHLSLLQNTLSVALITLWITGIVIVVRDASLSGWGYYLNPKIQAKVVIVSLLTLNGLLLHHTVMPALKKAGALLNLSFGQRMVAVFSGSVSAVSWFYAAMLGIGRPLNWKYSLEQLLAIYPALIVSGFVMMLLLTVWAKYRSTAFTGALDRRVWNRRSVTNPPASPAA